MNAPALDIHLSLLLDAHGPCVLPPPAPEPATDPVAEAVRLWTEALTRPLDLAREKRRRLCDARLSAL